MLAASRRFERRVIQSLLPCLVVAFSAVEGRKSRRDRVATRSVGASSRVTETQDFLKPKLPFERRSFTSQVGEEDEDTINRNKQRRKRRREEGRERREYDDGEAARVLQLVHVVALPPARIMSAHTTLECTLQIWAMAKAKMSLEQRGSSRVQLLVLLEEEDFSASATHPVLQQIAAWLGNVRVAALPPSYLHDLVASLDHFRIESSAKRSSWLKTFDPAGNRTVTLWSSILNAAANTFPDADMYIISNSDIIPFPDLYQELVEDGGRAAISILRTDVFCKTKGDMNKCQGLLNQTETSPSTLTEEEMEELVQIASQVCLYFCCQCCDSRLRLLTSITAYRSGSSAIPDMIPS
eukprot:2938614-Rhodomonas_salina.4